MTVRIDTGSNTDFMVNYRWWVNFMNQRENGWDSWAELNEELAKYNARFIRFVETDIPHQVEFASEEDVTYFMLRWA